MQIKDLIRFLCATVAVAGLIAGFNFLIDPLQIFHPAWLTQARYSSNPRIGDAGLIRSQDFDAVFMGTSLGFQFRQGDINERLRGKFLNLAISGGTSKEQKVVLTAALTRDPKRIIWQMDDWMFRNSSDVDEYMPADLYRMNLKGIAEYLFSSGTSRESTWILLRLWRPVDNFARNLVIMGYLTFHHTDESELNAFPAHVDPSSVFNADHAKQAFELSLKSPSLVSYGFDDASMVANFDRDALGLFKDNPNTQFIVYFPPYSILHWIALRDVAPQALKAVYKFNEYQLESLSRLTNVVVYDFRGVEEITHNLDNYRDTVHHSMAINRQILAFIASGQHRIDRFNPTVAIENLKGQVERYNVPSDRRIESIRQ